MTQGKRLQILIKQSLYTQKALAEKINVDPNYISILVNSSKPIPDSFKYKLKNEMPNANLKWITDGKGQMFLPSYENENILLTELVNLITNNHTSLLKIEKYKIWFTMEADKYFQNKKV